MKFIIISLLLVIEFLNAQNREALLIGNRSYRYLDTLNSANNRLNILFLDACRDVPIGTKGAKRV